MSTEEIIAILRQQNPHLTDQDVFKFLCQHIDANAPGELLGYLVSGYAKPLKFRLSNEESDDIG